MVKVVAALVIALALLAPAATGVEFAKEDLHSDDSLWKLYERWGARYKVARDPGEKRRRFAIFKEKARRVYALHLQAAGDTPLGLNIFADMSDDEVRGGYKCRRTVVDDDGGTKQRRNVTARVARRGSDGTLPLPPSIDWRTKRCNNGQPCLTPVRDQGPCGSCWAQAAAAALESHNAIRGSSLVRLSEQELIDCDTESSGCAGGAAVHAFDYVTQNGGLASLDAYPYRARNGTCQSDDTSPVDLGMLGFERVPAYDEFQLMQAVGYGPVVVPIASNSTAFDDYYGGLFPGPCGTDIDHEMLLVGYGYNHWILMNSYGAGWGDKGYMLLPRSVESLEGMCGILTDGAVYPDLERF